MQAASPDEAALVVAAKVLGAFFFRRTPSTLFTRELVGSGRSEEQEYELLTVLEFNSTRKRQSVIIRQSDGSVRLYCKVQSQMPGLAIHLRILSPALLAQTSSCTCCCCPGDPIKSKWHFNLRWHGRMFLNRPVAQAKGSLLVWWCMDCNYREKLE